MKTLKKVGARLMVAFVIYVVVMCVTVNVHKFRHRGECLLKCKAQGWASSGVSIDAPHPFAEVVCICSNYAYKNVPLKEDMP